MSSIVRRGAKMVPSDLFLMDPISSDGQYSRPKSRKVGVVELQSM